MNCHSESTCYKARIERWREFYLRNPARFIEEHLDIKLTPFQRMLVMLIFWKRGKKK